MRNSVIDLFYDYIDKACMLIYDEIKTDYLQLLLRVSNDIANGINTTNLSEEVVDQLEAIYDKVLTTEIYKDEVRVAFELLLVKAFKHIDRSIELMTPDAIGYLLAYIVRYLANEESTIIDTALGTANLLQTISNNTYPEMHLVGIENDQMLVDVSVASSNLQDNDLKVYYQDVLTPIFEKARIVIGDLDCSDYDVNGYSKLLEKGVKYLPYLTIYERLNNIENEGYFIYIINSDFFNQEGVDEFRSELTKVATLVGLILLPDEMFLGNTKKCILIGKKEVMNQYQMAILNIASLTGEELTKTYSKITKMIEQIL